MACSLDGWCACELEASKMASEWLSALSDRSREGASMAVA
eukprot:CAMPEP_0196786340 /NCGR_PEP_ID=MMETSP1104-20130614/21161_1 /TAXON_ID=33652 /ORGANISM="Cafeteria sp., Strain Caron Lab Isolate" /LENGTH=39 /DNA_ID= /DNA_START= /DNA_END= /DNA_ORIENTATION=